jgi:rhamnose utilization protein RhaD (predicted bifunctional aldolase and dehydrogenase)
MEKMNFKYVSNLWNDQEAAKLAGVNRLVYRSNKLGSDQRITNTGGGNTSSKITEQDPLTGESVEVLWVKGSGGDLRTSLRENFSSLYQSKLIGLQKSYAARSDKGLKSQAEDDMVAAYNHTTFNLNPRASSIDTPLHSFIPAEFVDHMHPNAIISIAASKNCEQLTREVFNGEMEYVKWMRPGFELGLAMQAICKKHPKATAIMMGQHGFISWATTIRNVISVRSSSSRKHRNSSRPNIKPKAATPKRLAAQNIKRSRRKNATRFSLQSSRGCADRFHSKNASSPRFRMTRKFCSLPIPTAHPASPNLAQAAPTISCARKSNRCTSLGVHKPKARRR